MSVPTDENRDLLTVIALLKAKPGKEDELRRVCESILEPSLKDPGCHTYALHQGAADPTQFVFYEVWDSQADLEAHLASPHITAGKQLLPELMDGELQIIPLTRVGL